MPHTSQKPRHGRDKRSASIATRFTIDELALLKDAAARANKPLREWLRDISVAAASNCSYAIDPTFTEVVALRKMISNLFLALAGGLSLDVENFHALRREIATTKHETARELTSEYLHSRQAREGAATRA